MLPVKVSPKVTTNEDQESIFRIFLYKSSMYLSFKMSAAVSQQPEAISLSSKVDNLAACHEKLENNLVCCNNKFELRT